MDECIELFSETMLFTALNGYNGYWQFSIALQDRHETSSVFKAGTYQDIRISFIPENASAIHQRELDMA